MRQYAVIVVMSEMRNTQAVQDKMDPPQFHNQSLPRAHTPKKSPYWIPSNNRTLFPVNLSHPSSEYESDDSGRSSSTSSNASKGARRGGDLGPVRVNYNYQTTAYYHNINNHFLPHPHSLFSYYNSLNYFNNKRRWDGNRATMAMLNNLKMPTATLSCSHEISPDKLLAKSHLFEVKEKPKAMKSSQSVHSEDRDWRELSTEIWEKFIKHQQTEETFRNKMAVWKYLYINIKNAYPQYSLYIVGSSVTGFGSNRSDMDLCLVVESQDSANNRYDALTHLETVSRLIRNMDGFNSLELIRAKVPILKFRDSCYNLEIDLNCNNTVGIRNTHLMYSYAQLDWRVRPLVLVIKLWAQYRNINDPKNKTISSYSLELMVIYYLQHVGVLPCLQKWPYLFKNDEDIRKIDLFKGDISYEPENNEPLGKLLIGFLKYYTQFDYDNKTISVRLGELTCKLKSIRGVYDRMHEWKYLCIEEPFDLTNTARSVYDYFTFRRIVQVMTDSYARLKKERTLTALLPQVRERF